MTRKDLIRILMNTPLEGHRNLIRQEARAVVDEIFDAAIPEALRNGDVVRLPFGFLGVYEQTRKPMRGWFLHRVRVIYKKRKQIRFTEEVDLEAYEQEPTAKSPSAPLPRPQPPQSLDSNGEINPSERDSSAPRMSPKERRKLTAIGIKAGKSRRLIAQELNASERTIRRDLKALGITANKNPTATIRKPVAGWKGSSRGNSDRQAASRNQTKPQRSAPRNKNTPRFVLPESLKARQPKPLSPKTPSTEELRRQRVEEMLQLVDAWLVEQNNHYLRATNVLDKARNLVARSQDLPDRRVPESPMTAEQLLEHTRPPEMDASKSQTLFRREEICALWLARWLTAWAPQDKELRNDVLNQARARVSR